MADLFDKFSLDRTPIRWLTVDEGPLGELAKITDGYFINPILEGEISSRMFFNGKKCIIWSLNNYLGMGNIPELRRKEMAACQKWALAHPMGARMFSGNSTTQHELEQQLANFVHKEQALVCNYAYQGIMSAIDSLVDFNDVIVYDAQSHACIMDGIRLHKGKRLSFLHNDVANLEQQLKRATRLAERTKGGILLITEGVFSMSGEQGKLREIVALKEKYNFRLLVDDAHGFGALGHDGSGTGTAQGIQDGIDVLFSSFSKSMASVGGFLAGSSHVIEFIRYGIRSQMFSTAMPMVLLDANYHRLNHMKQHPELREQLWKNVEMLQTGLRACGFDLGKTNSQVTPVYLHCPAKEGARLIIDLRENYGVFCSAAMYPVVPKGVFILRMIPNATHTPADIQETLNAFMQVRRKLESGVYRVPLSEEYIQSLVSKYGKKREEKPVPVLAGEL